LINNTNS